MDRELQQEQTESVPSFVDFDFATPSMESLILDYLTRHQRATFVELEDEVPGFSGELTLKSAANRKTVLWTGISAAALHALHDLQAKQKIRYVEASLRTYQTKGRRLYLPVDDESSPTTHWTPVRIELSPTAH